MSANLMIFLATFVVQALLLMRLAPVTSKLMAAELFAAFASMGLAAKAWILVVNLGLLASMAALLPTWCFVVWSGIVILATITFGGSVDGKVERALSKQAALEEVLSRFEDR